MEKMEGNLKRQPHHSTTVSVAGTEKELIKKKVPGVVAYSYNPSPWEAEVGASGRKGL